MNKNVNVNLWISELNLFVKRKEIYEGIINTISYSKLGQSNRACYICNFVVLGFL